MNRVNKIHKNNRNQTFKKNDTTFKFTRHVSDTQYPSSVEGCLQVGDILQLRMDTEYPHELGMKIIIIITEKLTKKFKHM